MNWFIDSRYWRVWNFVEICVWEEFDVFSYSICFVIENIF